LGENELYCLFLCSFPFFFLSLPFFGLAELVAGLVGGLSVQYISVLNSLQSGKATREEEEARVVEQNGEGRGKREKVSQFLWPHTEEESAAWRCSWAWANFLRELSA